MSCLHVQKKKRNKLHRSANRRHCRPADSIGDPVGTIHGQKRAHCERGAPFPNLLEETPVSQHFLVVFDATLLSSSACHATWLQFRPVAFSPPEINSSL